MTAALAHLSPKLDLRHGQQWLTADGYTVRISSGPLDGGDEFPIYAIYVGGPRDGNLATYNRYGASLNGDRLTELLPDDKAAAAAAYLAEIFDDEIAIAGRLGWRNFGRPEHPAMGHKMYGTHDSARGHVARDCLVQMPQWRRSTDAAQLISRCKLTIAPSDAGVAVHAETGPSFRAIYSEHPSEDHAIWFAMCKAAIAYLEAK